MRSLLSTNLVWLSKGLRPPAGFLQQRYYSSLTERYRIPLGVTVTSGQSGLVIFFWEVADNLTCVKDKEAFNNILGLGIHILPHLGKSFTLNLGVIDSLSYRFKRQGQKREDISKNDWGVVSKIYQITATIDFANSRNSDMFSTQTHSKQNMGVTLNQMGNVLITKSCIQHP